MHIMSAVKNTTFFTESIDRKLMSHYQVHDDIIKNAEYEDGLSNRDRWTMETEA